MSNIEISFSSTGFEPLSQPADPGDTITIQNTTDDKIDLVYTAGSVPDPLTNITSGVQVPPHESVWGDVREVASNHTITFSANGFDCTVEVGPANYQIDADPESISPTALAVNPDDLIVFYNTSATTSITLDLDSPVTDPFGPEIGMSVNIDPTAQKDGVVQRGAAGAQVKVTVKGSHSAVSTIDVGSGDTESY
jgi:plastocyanin